VIARIIQPLRGSIKDSIQIWRALTQKALIESVAEWALAFTNCPLHPALPNASKNNLFPFISQLLDREN
jgi:hypothetical protein